MKFNIRSLYPHVWDKLAVKEDDREFLVRRFQPDSLLEASRVANLIAEIAGEHGIEDQVQISIDSERLTIFIHFSGTGSVSDAHYTLASSIDNRLGIS